MERVEAAHAELGEKPDGTPLPAKQDPPVYDERGNVRPRGTKGARPMSYDERVAIAQGIKAEKAKARRGTRKATARRS